MTSPAQSKPAAPASGPYTRRRIALLTQHGKERVIAPVLDAALGSRVERVGSFTRDIPVPA